MTSNDLVIRTERSVIDVVLSNEGRIIRLEEDVKSLRHEIADFNAEVQQEFKNVRQEMADGFKSVRQEMKEQYTTLAHNQELMWSEIRNLDKTMDRMIGIFGWGFALVAIAVAAAPMLREFFVSREARREREDLDRRIENKVREILSSRES